MLLVKNSWIGLLNWFPVQVRPQEGLCGCLAFLDNQILLQIIQAYQIIRLGTILSHRWGYKLAVLLWAWWCGDSTEWTPECVYMTHCSGTQIKQDYALSSLARQVTGFVLQAGKVMGCTLCSSASVSRAFGCAMQFPMCSLSEGLKTVFSNSWGYRLASLLGQSGETIFKLNKALCGPDPSQPTPQVPWLNGVLALL